MSADEFNNMTEHSSVERGVVAPSEFESIQLRRRNLASNDNDREMLDYQVASMAKTAENLKAMDVARNYIKTVYEEETDFREMAERMVSDASRIEIEARDPMLNPESAMAGYTYATNMHGIVKEGIQTQAEALMILHYNQILNHPANQDADTQAEYKTKLNQAMEGYKRARFWEVGVYPGHGGKNIVDLDVLGEVKGDVGLALSDAFGVTAIEHNAKLSTQTADRSQDSHRNQVNQEQEQDYVDGEFDDTNIPENEHGREVTQRLNEYRERILHARDRDLRWSLVDERTAYLRGLHTDGDGDLRVSLDEVEKVYVSGILNRIDPERFRESLDEELDELVAHLSSVDEYSPQLEAAIRFHFRGMLRVARYTEDHAGEINFDDNLEIQRMANLLFSTPQDRINRVFGRNRARAAAGGPRGGAPGGPGGEPPIGFDNVKGSEDNTEGELYKERLRWAELMLENELHTRFTPNLEPQFYRLLHGREKRQYDAMLQLARGTFVKKVTSTHPDEYGSDRNQDILQFKKEQAEILYNKEGAKHIMENYAISMVQGEVVLRDGRRFNIWECTDADRFLEMRQALREDLMEFDGLTELQAKEADVIGFGMLYAGLLAESCDSRYSYSGSMHSMPYAISSQEFRTVLHPQEYWEFKMSVGHEDYGPFGKWGTTQMKMIKEATGFNQANDAWVFVHTNNLDEYWTAERLAGQAFGVEDNQIVPKNAVLVRMPLTHPPTVLGSLWEETKANDRPILDYLINREPVPWEAVSEDFVGSYSAKLDKAYKLLNNYYKPDSKSRVDPNKQGWVEWASGFNEIRDARMKIARRENPVTGRRILADNGYHNLKVYAYLAVYGIRDPKNRIPYPRNTWQDRASDNIALHKRTVAYLDSGEGLDLKSD